MRFGRSTRLAARITQREKLASLETYGRVTPCVAASGCFVVPGVL